MKTLRITQKDYLKANRRASRQEEIEVHGKPVRISAVHKSKKKYDRKNEKAEFKKALPFFFAGLHFQGFVSLVSEGYLLVCCGYFAVYLRVICQFAVVILLGIWRLFAGLHLQGGGY